MGDINTAPQETYLDQNRAQHNGIGKLLVPTTCNTYDTGDVCRAVVMKGKDSQEVSLEEALKGSKINTGNILKFLATDASELYRRYVDAAKNVPNRTRIEVSSPKKGGLYDSVSVTTVDDNGKVVMSVQASNKHGEGHQVSVSRELTTTGTMELDDLGKLIESLNVSPRGENIAHLSELDIEGLKRELKSNLLSQNARTIPPGTGIAFRVTTDRKARSLDTSFASGNIEIYLLNSHAAHNGNEPLMIGLSYPMDRMIPLLGRGESK